MPKKSMSTKSIKIDIDKKFEKLSRAGAKRVDNSGTMPKKPKKKR